jgi:sugar/nucleoside kinase (ribokinase family)
MNSDLLCIGHVCHDQLDDGRVILGGTVSYASLLAKSLGCHPHILTSFGPDFQFLHVFEEQEIGITSKPSRNTTLFKNTYVGGDRKQTIYHRAETLYPIDLPDQLRGIPLIKFGTIADEVSYDLVYELRNTFSGASIQGWLRTWDEQGHVCPKALDWDILRYINVVLMSSEDIRGFEHMIPTIADTVEILVITNGERDAEIYQDGIKHEFPVFPIQEVDPTGAGDAFGITFLLEFHRTNDLAHAAIMAHCAASLVVEVKGVKRSISLDELLTRYEKYRKIRSL